jgi:XTP/dITP diphosphohydrolase
MPDFVFVTSNDLKVLAAQQACDQYGITFDRKDLDISELQSDSGEEIARGKAEQAYAELGVPIAITDDSWIIPGLNGFPGPYMKHVNKWLSVDDYLNLTRHLEDRRIILRSIIVYQDERGQQVFSTDIAGLLMNEPRGKSDIKHFMITSFDGGANSAAETLAPGYSPLKDLRTTWDDLCEWLQASQVAA